MKATILLDMPASETLDCEEGELGIIVPLTVKQILEEQIATKLV